MKEQIKRIIKLVVPEHVILFAVRHMAIFRSKQARRVFDSAQAGREYLDFSELERLQKKYQFPPEYGYDAKSTLKRGEERATEMLTRLDRYIKSEQLEKFLDVGCADAMTSYALRQKKKDTTGIDNSDARFDHRASVAGDALLQMDASRLDFQHNSFDVVFSYNSFEHFPYPASVLKEMIRVVKPDGFIYLSFDPLYMSAKGLHAYRSITVPYCQFLWSTETLKAFTKQEGLDDIDFDQVNGWTLEQFRKLWKRYSSQLTTLYYKESYDTQNLDLVQQYPSCFRSKVKYFDNLIVSGITAVFAKKGA